LPYAVLGTSVRPLQTEVVKYEAHQVWRYNLPADGPQRAILAGFITQHRLDLWGESRTWVDVRVPPLHQNKLAALSLPYTVLIDDLQALIEEEKTSIAAAKDDAFFTTYRNLDEFNAFLDDLVARFPALVTKKLIGMTVEQRPIYGITITSTKKPTGKSGIVYNGGQHAREWISPMTNAWIANELVTRYGNDAKITRYVDEFEWTIIPIVNADGYWFSWNIDRMWRKNRRYNEDSWFECYGVDTNRNWDFQWNKGGSSPDTCAETYHGPFGFSEPEETALANYIRNQKNVKGYIDFHAYSQLWMTPWGYTSALPKDYNKQLLAARACVTALEAVYGTQYEYGPIATTIYPASGSSVDWVYAVTNVTISFAVEGRDTGRFGFLLPADQIIPSGKETMAAVEAMAEFILTNP